MVKKCPKCNRFLPLSDFNWKVKNIRRQAHCKSCSREYIRLHYLANTQYYLDKARRRNKMVKDRSYEYLGPYLLSHPCIDCGEKDILVLEFDHRDRRMKDSEISHIIQNGATLEKLKKEVEKCDVRCSSCHRRKTELENNSWKLKYAPVA